MRTYDLDIVMVCSGLPMHGGMLEEGKSLGGSESAAIGAATELARQGHHVFLFCNTDKPHEYEKVFYVPFGWIKSRDGSGFPKTYLDYARTTPTDLLIVQRLPQFFAYQYPTKCNFLWQHDLATKTGPSDWRQVAWNLDRVLVLSQFMKHQYQSIHGGPDRLFHLTRNGIDLKMIDSVPAQPRDRFRLTYTARPERGLDILLGRVFPLILQMEPRARLYLSRYDDVANLPLYEQLSALAAQFGDRVVNLGNLGKQALYDNYKRSRLFLYPSAFEEISWITSQEAGACGLPIIGPWRGACPETCRGAHVLLKDDGSRGVEGDPLDPGFKGVSDAFVRAVAEEAVDLMHNDERWEQYSKVARARAEEWLWGPVVENWVSTAHEVIATRSGEPRRLTKHFLINSDVVAAHKFAAKTGNPSVQRAVDKYVTAYVPFVNESDAVKRKQAMAAFYESRSGGTGADFRTAFWADAEPRLKVFLDWVRPKIESGEVKSILDFGCAHGGYARVISNAFPMVKVLGVDVAPSLVRCAEELKNATLPDGTRAVFNPDNVKFGVADEDTDFSQDSSFSGWLGSDRFDLVLCMEVLEHLPHAEEAAAKLERYCKPGGWMVFTVPYGHRERDEFVNQGVPPVHVRSFDLHDLRDIFGKREDYGVISFSDLNEIPLDHTYGGWFMALYRASRSGYPLLGQIDWDRKFFLQAPAETVSACLITHNSEVNLRRCMNSLQKVADQIIVLDNGPSTDRTVEMAKEYTDEVYSGTSPFWCYAHVQRHTPEQIQPGVCRMAGFETPRNESTEGAWGDWIYWQDSDEELMDPSNMYKYLRPNLYLGYAVNQHHVSIEPGGTLKKDIPVRLFRNKVGIKCFGLVHEHFELGINRGIGADVNVTPDLNIYHDGYLTESIRRGRFARNLRMLECDRLKYPDRMLGIYLYDVRDNVHLARYILEQNGGQVTPEVQAHCQRVVDAYRKHFLGKPGNILTEEGINYYSEALGILGLGIEVVADVGVSRVNAQPTGMQKFRAMNAEEAAQMISLRLKGSAYVFEGPYAA